MMLIRFFIHLILDAILGKPERDGYYNPDLLDPNPMPSRSEL
jgi:hypothetical protein